MPDDAQLTFNRVSSDAVREATGQGWDHWLAALDAAGAVAWDHKAIVAHLQREYPDVSGWWQQSITVGYEKARGKRVLGETADAGFQVGVQRSVDATPETVWEVLTARTELWLGRRAAIDLDAGGPYEVPSTSVTPKVTGDLRVIKPADRLRMTWHPEDWEAPATLQLTVRTSASGKTVIGAHLERLPDADTREQMRDHWRGVLDRLVTAIG